MKWYAFLDFIQAYGFRHRAPPSQTPASYTAPSRGPRWVSSKSVISGCVFPLSENGNGISAPRREISKLSWNPCLLPSQPRPAWSKVLRILALHTTLKASARLCFQLPIISCLGHYSGFLHIDLPAPPSDYVPHCFHVTLSKPQMLNAQSYQIISILKILQWFPIIFRMKSKILGLV